MITERELSSEFYSGPQAAKILKVNNSRIRQLCLSGRFEGAFKFGDTWLIPRVLVDNYRRGRPGPKPKDSEIEKEQNYELLRKFLDVANSKVEVGR